MFTGLVEEIGEIRRVESRGDMRVLRVGANRVLEGVQKGDSIAIDGVCQTVTGFDGESFAVDTLAASLTKTTLGSFQVGRRVNLERALLPTTRLGGHFVQGHVDGTARVERAWSEGANRYLSVRLPEDLAPFCVREGSIAVDGVSLTIAELAGTLVTINVIPTTWDGTCLGDRRAGARVNIEVDVLARYVARMSEFRSPSSRGITTENLKAMGY